MKQVVSNLALIAVSLAIAGGASEIVLRHRFGAPPVWTYPQEAYEPDSELGFRLVPEQRAFTHDQPVEVNSLGMRDREYPRAAPLGVHRLIALGDSQTFGAGLALADTWPKQLERELGEADAANRWEVVNAGVDGTATWNQEIILRRASDALELDGCVVGFYVNDVLPAPGSPQAALEAFVAQQTNTGSKRAAYLLKRSALFVAAWEARHPIRAWLAGRTESWEEKILSGSADPLVEAGWRQVEQSLASMKQFADERGLSFWLLALPRRDQVAGVQAGRAYQRRLAEISERLGVRSIDALSALQAAYAAQSSGLFIAWDGHNSAAANAVIAHVIAREVRAAQ